MSNVNTNARWALNIAAILDGFVTISLVAGLVELDVRGMEMQPGMLQVFDFCFRTVQKRLGLLLKLTHPLKLFVQVFVLLVIEFVCKYSVLTKQLHRHNNEFWP